MENDTKVELMFGLYGQYYRQVLQNLAELQAQSMPLEYKLVSHQKVSTISFFEDHIEVYRSENS